MKKHLRELKDALESRWPVSVNITLRKRGHPRVSVRCGKASVSISACSTPSDNKRFLMNTERDMKRAFREAGVSLERKDDA